MAKKTVESIMLEVQKKIASEAPVPEDQGDLDHALLTDWFLDDLVIEEAEEEEEE